MLFRFSLYGFLKNQRFFEAFLLLALLDRGLPFAAIGGLIAVREVTIVLLEVPSGAAADALGRKHCMVVSMAGYVVSYALLGLTTSWWLLAAAMVLFGLGDAFRSGTHKAMILAWLRQQDRLDERTRVYGYTRSWSKLGSACSALVGGALLVLGADYEAMFLASAGVAVLNLVNLATYPRSLDEPRRDRRGALRATWRQLRDGLGEVAAPGRLRTLVATGASAQACYKVVKDYLQPVLQALVLALPFAAGLAHEQRLGIVVGVVSAALFVIASLASRRAHAFEERFGDADRCAGAIVTGMILAYGLLAAAVLLGWSWLAVLLFVTLAVLQNLWRPVQVGRIGEAAAEERSATVLSLESQAHALAVAVLAPALGGAVDWLAAGADPAPVTALWPLGLLALPLLALRVTDRATVEARADHHG